jgi:proteasome lid subunit RPN8/RPN11
MDRIRLDLQHWNLMLRHVQEWFPEEACGLLGGLDEEVIDVLPVTNVLHSPVRYRMDPQEQYNAMLKIEETGHKIIGIFHSHINGPEDLSVTDLTEASYPDSAYLVWSRLNQNWNCKAFMINKGVGLEIPIIIQEQATP